jgi:hypothetical protein
MEAVDLGHMAGHDWTQYNRADWCPRHPKDSNATT